MADPFGMSAFDASGPAYVNTKFTGSNIQPQRVTIGSDIRTPKTKSESDGGTYINAPADPWAGMQPLVQFGQPDENAIVHPSPPAHPGELCLN